MTRPLALACVAALGAACASGPTLPDFGSRGADTPAGPSVAEVADAAVSALAAQQARVLDVSWRIRTRNVDVCGERVGPALGIAVWRSDELLSDAFRDALLRRYGDAARGVFVVALQPGSPAARAGLHAGDRIERVAANRVFEPSDVFDRARAVRDGPVAVEIERDGVPVEIAVAREIACRHQVELEIGDLMLSDRVGRDDSYVTTGFVGFTRSDDELALVIGHEIAHRLLGPIAMGGHEVETRADEVGMLLAARAGYDVSVAPAFWDRVAVEQPWSLSNEVEHTGWSRVPPHGYMPARAVAVRQLAESIPAMLAAGEPAAD